MPYVQLDNGTIVGVYANAQPGYAEEWREDDDADVVAYLNPPPKPPELAPYQFRAMLALSGKQAALDAFIAALPDPQKTIAQAKLDYSLTFRRDNDLVLAAQQALGLTDAELDALWTSAAQIT
jgi:hypothetical protein